MVAVDSLLDMILIDDADDDADIDADRLWMTDDG
jgi:hypothetical protein